MASEALIYLAYLAIILLLGLLTSSISHKFGVPNALLLIVIGMIIGKSEYNGVPLIHFPKMFMAGIIMLALVMIVFDSWSRLKLKKDYFSLHALWLSIIFLIFNLIFLTWSTKIIFGFESLFIALIFSVLMSGTDIGFLSSMLKNSYNKVFEFLKLEALLNAPIMMVLPFIILGFGEAIKDGVISIDQIWLSLQQFFVGIGAGLLIGIIMFKFIAKKYSDVWSPLAIIASALLAYIIAENLDGNGILAVASLGLLFGLVHLDHKSQLHSFSSIFLTSLEMLILVLIGLMVSIELSAAFLINSILLFLIYILIRFASILFALRGMNFSLKEKVFMAISMQKGLATAVVVFYFATLGIESLRPMLELSIAFMVYSMLLSVFAVRNARFFIPMLRRKTKN